MHRIFKALKALGHIMKNPWLLNRVLAEPALWKTRVCDKYGITDGLPVITFNDLFGSYNENLEIFTFLDGGSLATDVALLKSLARRFDKCKFFEIGTWRGETVANVASVADVCYTLNLPDSDLKKTGVSDPVIEQQSYFSRHLKEIVHLKGNSAHFDFASLNMKFDLIFIDGDHHYDFVKNDTEKVFTHLVHGNSIVVWHDYATEPGKVRHEVLAGILDALPETLHPFLYYVAHTKSAVFTREKLSINPVVSSQLKPPGYYTIGLQYNKFNNEPS